MEWFDKFKDVVFRFARQPARSLEGFRKTGVQAVPTKFVFFEVHVNTTTTTTDNSTTYGNRIHGDVIGNNFVDSMNVINRLQGSTGATPDLQKQLVDLHALVKELAAHLSADDAETVSRDLKQFVDETTSKKPRAEQCIVSGKGLIDAAKTVAKLVAPITTAVKGVIALLVPGASV